jgi:hypothetical protein
MQSSFSIALNAATVQDIQLELMRRTCFNAFDGEKVVSSLMAHRHLWTAVLLDRFGLDRRPGKLPTSGLIKLRDLDGNFWNADTLYILTPNAECARELAQLATDEDWGGEEPRIYTNQKEVDAALGGADIGQAIVSIWWD